VRPSTVVHLGCGGVDPISMPPMAHLAEYLDVVWRGGAGASPKHVGSPKHRVRWNLGQR
jgi:hypothetical protein